MQTHNLKRKTENKTKKIVGRGGLRGKTSGRGHKGQRQHGGHGIRPELRDLIKKIPKLRGHGKNRGRTVYSEREIHQTVSLAKIETNFEAGDKVTIKDLVEKNLVEKNAGKNPMVKILGTGDLTKKLTFIGCATTKSAREAIEKVGGIIK
jgi:large subunit ribosomal protein L15